MGERILAKRQHMKHSLECGIINRFVRVPMKTHPAGFKVLELSPRS